MCALCGGYFIDATTIVECLHSCKWWGHSPKEPLCSLTAVQGRRKTPWGGETWRVQPKGPFPFSPVGSGVPWSPWPPQKVQCP